MIMPSNTWIEQFPEFEEAIREGWQLDRVVLPLEVLLTGRDLARVLTDWTDLEFLPFYLTQTLWFTFEAKDRSHMTISVKNDLGLMVLWNTSDDPLHQDEIHFKDCADLYENGDAVRSALKELGCR